jgi:hypothetical protein
MTIEKPREMDLAALDSTLQQLQKKKEVLAGLDNNYNNYTTITTWRAGAACLSSRTFW